MKSLLIIAIVALPLACQCEQESVAFGSAELADLPRPALAKDFSDLMKNSPFMRSLDLSGSLILTGVARVEGKPVATLMNKETKETYVVSETPNAQGWTMVEISDGADLAKVIAKIALPGGEVLTVRFDEAQLKPGEAKRAAGLGKESEAFFISKKTIIPSVEFDETPIREAFAYYQSISKEHGVRVILHPYPGRPPGNKTITLKLKNVPLSTGLKYTAYLAGMQLKFENDAVHIVPKADK